jgi:GTP cyclohydrolase I
LQAVANGRPSLFYRYLLLMRGVEKQGSATTTSAFTGVFLSHPPTRQEFMTLISNKYR